MVMFGDGDPEVTVIAPVAPAASGTAFTPGIKAMLAVPVPLNVPPLLAVNRAVPVQVSMVACVGRDV